MGPILSDIPDRHRNEREVCERVEVRESAETPSKVSASGVSGQACELQPVKMADGPQIFCFLSPLKKNINDGKYSVTHTNKPHSSIRFDQPPYKLPN